MKNLSISEANIIKSNPKISEYLQIKIMFAYESLRIINKMKFSNFNSNKLYCRIKLTRVTRRRAISIWNILQDSTLSKKISIRITPLLETIVKMYQLSRLVNKSSAILGLLNNNVAWMETHLKDQLVNNTSKSCNQMDLKSLFRRHQPNKVVFLLTLPNKKHLIHLTTITTEN